MIGIAWMWTVRVFGAMLLTSILWYVHYTKHHFTFLGFPAFLGAVMTYGGGWLMSHGAKSRDLRYWVMTASVIATALLFDYV